MCVCGGGAMKEYAENWFWRKTKQNAILKKKTTFLYVNMNIRLTSCAWTTNTATARLSMALSVTPRPTPAARVATSVQRVNKQSKMCFLTLAYGDTI